MGNRNYSSMGLLFVVLISLTINGVNACTIEGWPEFMCFEENGFCYCNIPGWFIFLIILGIGLTALMITALMCCICPCCPWFACCGRCKKKKSHHAQEVEVVAAESSHKRPQTQLSQNDFMIHAEDDYVAPNPFIQPEPQPQQYHPQ